MKGTGLSDLLGTDLAELVLEVGAGLVEARPLTRLPAPGRETRCFRLEFDDGRILKGRSVGSVAGARRVQELSRLLEPQHFPRVVACRGRAMLTEWRHGRPVTDADMTASMLGDCGALHGRIHAVPIAADGDRIRPTTVPEEEAHLAEELTSLVVSDALSGAEAEQALVLARGSIPTRFDVGLTHMDLCAENMLVNAAGDLAVIDNEALAVEALDLDLARTWYRWPMRPDQRRRYFDGYHRYRASASFREHFFYWAVRAVVRSALFRFRNGTAERWVPIRALRALLRGARTRSSGDPVLHLRP